MREGLLCILVAVAAYLLGCFSTGITISSLKGINIREHGSKNTGASNVLRVLGVRSGVLTFVGDSLKATLACLLGLWLLPGATFGVERFGVLLAGLFVVLGHNWPVFYHFKGGKGVACSVAVLLFADPLWGAVAIVLCLAVIALTRYISLGSMTMLLSFAVLVWLTRWGQWALCLFALIMLALCLWRHRTNIQRLLSGTVNKIGHKAR